MAQRLHTTPRTQDAQWPAPEESRHGETEHEDEGTRHEATEEGARGGESADRNAAGAVAPDVDDEAPAALHGRA